jgi:hypothetical protein
MYYVTLDIFEFTIIQLSRNNTVTTEMPKKYKNSTELLCVDKQNIITVAF